MNDSRLHELSGSGYEMADGDPDIRGWNITNNQEQSVGKVDELIFDPQSCKVRYMIVNLEGKALNINSKKVLVPIGLAELHEHDDDVILPNVTADQLASLPEYKKGDITMTSEKSIRNIFSREATAVTAGAGLADYENDDETFYNHEHFNENNLYNRRRKNTENETTIPVIEENINVGKRIVETGGVRIKSNITEKPVQETVQLKEEHVTVDRKTVDKPVQNSSFAPFEESTIELTEHAEVPVVAKEARVIEEISVGKDVEHREETIRDTVRKTEVDVEEINKGNLSSNVNSNDL